ncbi:response regulator [Sulfurimonas sp.]|uniref:response regulator n=1 Tax=Sulfurimonas sp. TaxID=2022749 RepID=UPI003D0F2564
MNKKYTILIVDDNETNLVLLDAIISMHFEHRVIQFKSAKEALKIMKTMEVDIVLSDIQMPDMDGYEFTREIKSNPLTKHIPVLLLSATERNDINQIKAYQEGAIGFIAKPINSKLLIAKLGSCLDIVASQKEIKKKITKD